MVPCNSLRVVQLALQLEPRMRGTALFLEVPSLFVRIVWKRFLIDC